MSAPASSAYTTNMKKKKRSNGGGGVGGDMGAVSTACAASAAAATSSCAKEAAAASTAAPPVTPPNDCPFNSQKSKSTTTTAATAATSSGSSCAIYNSKHITNKSEGSQSATATASGASSLVSGSQESSTASVEGTTAPVEFKTSIGGMEPGSAATAAAANTTTTTSDQLTSSPHLIHKLYHQFGKLVQQNREMLTSSDSSIPTSTSTNWTKAIGKATITTITSGTMMSSSARTGTILTSANEGCRCSCLPLAKPRNQDSISTVEAPLPSSTARAAEEHDDLQTLHPSSSCSSFLSSISCQSQSFSNSSCFQGLTEEEEAAADGIGEEEEAVNTTSKTITFEAQLAALNLQYQQQAHPKSTPSPHSSTSRMVHEINPNMNDNDVVVNSASLEDVVNNELNNNHAQSIQSLHSVLDTPTPSDDITFDQLQERLETSARNMQQMQEEHKRLLKLHDLAKRNLTETTDILGDVDELSFATTGRNGNRESASPPHYDSIEAVSSDVNSLTTRMETLTALLKRQDQLSNMLNEKNHQFDAERESLERTIAGLQTKHEDLWSLVEQLNDANRRCEQTTKEAQQTLVNEKDNDSVKTLSTDRSRGQGDDDDDGDCADEMTTDSDEQRLSLTAPRVSNATARVVPIQLLQQTQQQHQRELNQLQQLEQLQQQMRETRDSANATAAELFNADDDGKIDQIQMHLRRLHEMMQTLNTIDQSSCDADLSACARRSQTRSERERTPVANANHDNDDDDDDDDDDADDEQKLANSLLNKYQRINRLTDSLRNQADTMHSEGERIKALKEDCEKRTRQAAAAAQMGEDALKRSSLTPTPTPMSALRECQQESADLVNEHERLRLEYERRKEEFKKLCEALDSNNHNAAQQAAAVADDDDGGDTATEMDQHEAAYANTLRLRRLQRSLTPQRTSAERSNNPLQQQQCPKTSDATVSGVGKKVVQGRQPLEALLPGEYYLPSTSGGSTTALASNNATPVSSTITITNDNRKQQNERRRGAEMTARSQASTALATESNRTDDEEEGQYRRVSGGRTTPGLDLSSNSAHSADSSASHHIPAPMAYNNWHMPASALAAHPWNLFNAAGSGTGGGAAAASTSHIQLPNFQLPSSLTPQMLQQRQELYAGLMQTPQQQTAPQQQMLTDAMIVQQLAQMQTLLINSVLQNAQFISQHQRELETLHWTIQTLQERVLSLSSGTGVNQNTSIHNNLSSSHRCRNPSELSFNMRSESVPPPPSYHSTMFGVSQNSSTAATTASSSSQMWRAQSEQPFNFGGGAASNPLQTPPPLAPAASYFTPLSAGATTPTIPTTPIAANFQLNSLQQQQNLHQLLQYSQFLQQRTAVMLQQMHGQVPNGQNEQSATAAAPSSNTNLSFSAALNNATVVTGSGGSGGGVTNAAAQQPTSVTASAAPQASATAVSAAPMLYNNELPTGLNVAGSNANACGAAAGPGPIFMHHHNNAIHQNNANLRTQNQQQQQLNNHIASTTSGGAASSAATAAGQLNNQVPPGNRANNYWDNFRSYSRQNLLSSNSSKSNEDYHLQQQHQQQLHLSTNAFNTPRLSPSRGSSALLSATSAGSLDHHHHQQHEQQQQHQSGSWVHASSARGLGRGSLLSSRNETAAGFSASASTTFVSPVSTPRFLDTSNDAEDDNPHRTTAHAVLNRSTLNPRVLFLRSPAATLSVPPQPATLAQVAAAQLAANGVNTGSDGVGFGSIATPANVSNMNLNLGSNTACNKVPVKLPANLRCDDYNEMASTSTRSAQRYSRKQRQRHSRDYDNGDDYDERDYNGGDGDMNNFQRPSALSAGRQPQGRDHPFQRLLTQFQRQPLSGEEQVQQPAASTARHSTFGIGDGNVVSSTSATAAAAMAGSHADVGSTLKNDSMSEQVQRNLLVNAFKNEKFTDNFYETIKEDLFRRLEKSILSKPLLDGKTLERLQQLALDLENNKAASAVPLLPPTKPAPPPATKVEPFRFATSAVAPLVPPSGTTSSSARFPLTTTARDTPSPAPRSARESRRHRKCGNKSNWDVELQEHINRILNNGADLLDDVDDDHHFSSSSSSLSSSTTSLNSVQPSHRSRQVRAVLGCDIPSKDLRYKILRNYYKDRKQAMLKHAAECSCCPGPLAAAKAEKKRNNNIRKVLNSELVAQQQQQQSQKSTPPKTVLLMPEQNLKKIDAALDSGGDDDDTLTLQGAASLAAQAQLQNYKMNVDKKNEAAIAAPTKEWQKESCFLATPSPRAACNYDAVVRSILWLLRLLHPHGTVLRDDILHDVARITVETVRNPEFSRRPLVLDATDIYNQIKAVHMEPVLIDDFLCWYPEFLERTFYKHCTEKPKNGNDDEENGNAEHNGENDNNGNGNVKGNAERDNGINENKDKEENEKDDNDDVDDDISEDNDRKGAENDEANDDKGIYNAGYESQDELPELVPNDDEITIVGSEINDELTAVDKAVADIVTANGENGEDKENLENLVKKLDQIVIDTDDASSIFTQLDCGASLCGYSTVTDEAQENDDDDVNVHRKNERKSRPTTPKNCTTLNSKSDSPLLMPPPGAVKKKRSNSQQKILFPTLDIPHPLFDSPEEIEYFNKTTAEQKQKQQAAKNNDAEATPTATTSTQSKSSPTQQQQQQQPTTAKAGQQQAQHNNNNKKNKTRKHAHKKHHKRK